MVRHDQMSKCEAKLSLTIVLACWRLTAKMMHRNKKAVNSVFNVMLLLRHVTCVMMHIPSSSRMLLLGDVYCTSPIGTAALSAGG